MHHLVGDLSSSTIVICIFAFLLLYIIICIIPENRENSLERGWANRDNNHAQAQKVDQDDDDDEENEEEGYLDDDLEDIYYTTLNDDEICLTELDQNQITILAEALRDFDNHMNAKVFFEKFMPILERIELEPHEPLYDIVMDMHDRLAVLQGDTTALDCIPWEVRRDGPEAVLESFDCNRKIINALNRW